MLGVSLVHRHVGDRYGDVLANEIVHRAFKTAQAFVVGARQVEIHARRPVLGHLHACHQRAIELLEDQRVQHMVSV